MNSLMNPPESQQDLPLVGASFFDESVSDLVTGALESGGDHTAAHLFSKNPQVYKAIMFMYASGSAGQLKIASVLHVSVHTVRAVIQREKLFRGAAMDTVKTLESLSDLRTMTLETLIEKLSDENERSKIPFDKLMIGLGIQTEKIELLRGNATERIEHVKTSPASEDFERWLKDGAIDADSFETGLPGPESDTKGERDSAGALATTPADPGACAPGHMPTARQIGSGDPMPNNRDNVGINAGKPNENGISKESDVSCDVSSAPRNGHQDGSDVILEREAATPSPGHDPAQEPRGGGGHDLPPSQQGAMNE